MIQAAKKVQRIALLGGESTGKSTLAEALAERLETEWVHEYGRELWIEKGAKLDFEDLLHIGKVQIEREEAAAARVQDWVICDTTPLTTQFYCEEDFGRVDPQLVELARRPYAHTFLCQPDFAFVQDGFRQDDQFRDRQQLWYERMLAEQGVAYTRLSGSVGERVDRVIEVLRQGS